MDCRFYRKNHVAFVDDTLPGVDVVRMQLHLAECEVCAGWDHRVRRSLMLVRSHLGEIQPSEGFRGRLDERLAHERSRIAVPPRMFTLGGRTTVGVLGLALASVSFAYVSLTGGSQSEAAELVRLPAVTTYSQFRGERNEQANVDATPAFVASVSSGMAILPALMLADDMVSADVSPTLVQAVSLSGPGSR